MKKTFCIALLSLGLLNGCGVTSGQAVQVDAKTRLMAHLGPSSVGGAGFQPKFAERKSLDEPVHRVIENSAGKVLFAYDLEVAKASDDGFYTFRLKPSAQKPTFAAPREVSVNLNRESVQIELMEQPKTGVKVLDVYQLVRTDSELMSPMAHLKRLHNMVFNYVHGH